MDEQELFERRQRLIRWCGGNDATSGSVYSDYLRASRARNPLFSPSVSIHSGSDSSENPDEKDRREDLIRERKGIQIWARYRYDHPSGGAVPVPQAAFAFMQLPPELTSGILKLLLARSKGVQQLPADLSTKCYFKVPVDTRLFAVSRAMPTLAEDVFFAHNRFVIHLYDRLPLSILRSLTKQNFRHVRLIPQLHIHCELTARVGAHPNALKPRLKMLANVLALCTRIRGRILLDRTGSDDQSVVFADNVHPLTLFDTFARLVNYVERNKLGILSVHLHL